MVVLVDGPTATTCIADTASLAISPPLPRCTQVTTSSVAVTTVLSIHSTRPGGGA